MENTDCIPYLEIKGEIDGGMGWALPWIQSSDFIIDLLNVLSMVLRNEIKSACEIRGSSLPLSCLYRAQVSYLRRAMARECSCRRFFWSWTHVNSCLRPMKAMGALLGMDMTIENPGNLILLSIDSQNWVTKLEVRNCLYISIRVIFLGCCYPYHLFIDSSQNKHVADSYPNSLLGESSTR